MWKIQITIVAYIYFKFDLVVDSLNLIGFSNKQPLLHCRPVAHLKKLEQILLSRPDYGSALNRCSSTCTTQILFLQMRCIFGLVV